MTLKKNMTTDTLRPEWSHKIDTQDIKTVPLRAVISASPQERKDLARRLQVSSIDNLEADLTLRREPGNLVLHVDGVLKARVTQPCVVSLEPVQQEIEGPVEGWFTEPDGVVSLAKVRHEKKGKSSNAELPMLEETEDPEPIINGQIDIAELVAQHLSLAVDLYPHKPGLEPPEGAEKVKKIAAPASARQNPFAALKLWKAAKDKEK